VEGRGCPEIAIGCVEGMECPTPPPCETEDVNVCTPAPCDSDADCGDSMVCFTQTSMACSGGGTAGCAPGEECKPAVPIEPECHSITESWCVPPWVPPCAEDADCGPGFHCVEEIARGCSSSAGRPTPGSGEPAPPPPPPMCFEEPTGRFVCELVQQACSTDADCGAGLTCAQNPTYPVCSPPSDGGANSGSCGDPGVPVRVCLPPGYVNGGYGGTGPGEATTTQTTPDRAEDPKDADDLGNNGGNTNGTPSGSTGGTPGDGDANGPTAEGAPPPRLVRSGCSTAGAGQASWPGLIGFMLIAAAPLLRRRRRPLY
jgi:MYXO-CTERM domain-containing protein